MSSRATSTGILIPSRNGSSTAALDSCASDPLDPLDQEIPEAWKGEAEIRSVLGEYGREVLPMPGLLRRNKKSPKKWTPCFYLCVQCWPCRGRAYASLFFPSLMLKIWGNWRFSSCFGASFSPSLDILVIHILLPVHCVLCWGKEQPQSVTASLWLLS